MQATMEREFLQLDVWDQFTQAEAEAVAQALERCLPAPWRFGEVAWFEMGEQRRFVAFFDLEVARFALIPGGEVTLGYERGSLLLRGQQRQLWDEAGAEWGWDLDKMLDGALTPLRRLAIRPFLLEV